MIMPDQTFTQAVFIHSFITGIENMGATSQHYSGRFITLTLLSLLVSCGGGQGGGNQGSSNSPQSDIPPLRMTDTNAAVISNLGMYYGVVPLGLAQKALDWFDYINPSDLRAQTTSCSGGGYQTVELKSAGQGFFPEPGDQLIVTLNHCYLKPIQNAYSGKITITYKSPEAGFMETGIINLGAGLTDDTSIPTTISGQFVYDYALVNGTGTGTSKSIRVRSSSAPLILSVSYDGKTYIDHIAELHSERQINAETYRTGSSINYRGNSALLNGTFSVITSQPWVSDFQHYPIAGETLITTADNNSAAVTASDINPAQFEVYFNDHTYPSGVVDVFPFAYLFSGTGWLLEDDLGIDYTMSLPW